MILWNNQSIESYALNVQCRKLENAVGENLWLNDVKLKWSDSVCELALNILKGRATFIFSALIKKFNHRVILKFNTSLFILLLMVA